MPAGNTIGVRPHGAPFTGKLKLSMGFVDNNKAPSSGVAREEF
jgi:hypothetical protein